MSDINDQNDGLSIEDLTLAAQKGDPEAQFQLGKRKVGQADHFGSEYDPGIRWLERAAIFKQHVGARRFLAQLFLTRSYNPVDEKQAVSWAIELASTGSDDAKDFLIEYLRKTIEKETSEPDQRQADVKNNQIHNNSGTTKANSGNTPDQNTTPIISQFEFGQSKEPQDQIDVKLFKLGVQCGLKCLDRAEMRLTSLRFIRRHPDLSGIAPKFLGEMIAEQYGYLDVGSDYGMAGMIDGADPLFDQRRNSFILGVYDGLDGNHPDESADKFVQIHLKLR